VATPPAVACKYFSHFLIECVSLRTVLNMVLQPVQIGHDIAQGLHKLLVLLFAVHRHFLCGERVFGGVSLLERRGGPPSSPRCITMIYLLYYKTSVQSVPAFLLVEEEAACAAAPHQLLLFVAGGGAAATGR
jgi:hypothetical protein